MGPPARFSTGLCHDGDWRGLGTLTEGDRVLGPDSSRCNAYMPSVVVISAAFRVIFGIIPAQIHRREHEAFTACPCPVTRNPHPPHAPGRV